MRTRQHFIGLWLNDAEYAQLMKQCAISGLSSSTILRASIMGLEIKAKPPETYAALLRELSAIGSNVNQIARWANTLKYISEFDILMAADLVQKAWRLVKDAL